METTESNITIQDLAARVRALELDFAALIERLAAERERNEAKSESEPEPSSETPGIDFSSIGGRMIAPPEDYTGRPPVDLSAAYGTTGRRVR
jgi:hypothetical protein